MRDIKFRGRRTVLDGPSEWIYGYGAIDNDILHLDLYRGSVRIECDKGTIGQFTGRNDTGNVNELFEHDIVDITLYSPFQTSNGKPEKMFKRRCVVEYRQGQLCFIEGYKTSCEIEWNACVYVKDANISKIGNIHDNPNLLESEV